MNKLTGNIRFDGLEITPGQSFIPFPTEDTAYVVTYLGIDGTTLRLSDCHGVFTRPIHPTTPKES